MIINVKREYNIVIALKEFEFEAKKKYRNINL